MRSGWFVPPDRRLQGHRDEQGVGAAEAAVVPTTPSAMAPAAAAMARLLTIFTVPPSMLTVSIHRGPFPGPIASAHLLLNWISQPRPFVTVTSPPESTADME